MADPNEQSRPAHNRTAPHHFTRDTSLAAGSDLLADLDARAEAMRGLLVVEVTIGDGDKTRRYLYRSTNAAERCVLRARLRGADARVVLCQLLPVGVVTGLGGGLR